MELPKETIERIEREANEFIISQGNNTIGLNAYPANLGYIAGAKSEALRNLKEKEELLARIEKLEEQDLLLRKEREEIYDLISHLTGVNSERSYDSKGNPSYGKIIQEFMDEKDSRIKQLEEALSEFFYNTDRVRNSKEWVWKIESLLNNK